MIRVKLNTIGIWPDGCFSALEKDGKRVCYTCERTFDDGRPIIPDGVFVCKRTTFIRGGYPSHEITGVVGHTRLLVHKGNTELDSVGCILVGTSIGELNGHKAVLGSKDAFARYWAELGFQTEYELEVVGRATAFDDNSAVPAGLRSGVDEVA